MATDGYYTGALDSDAPVIPGGIYVPICNMESDLIANVFTAYLFYFVPERGAWDQKDWKYWTASANDDAWEDSSKIDSRFVFVNRSCVGQPILYAVKMPEPFVFHPDSAHMAKNACIIFSSDGSISGNQAELANQYCEIYPGRPTWECHVTPSQTQWDLGVLTAGGLAEKQLDFVLDTSCDDPSIEELDAVITITYTETDNVKMEMKDEYLRPVDGSYTLKQGRPFPISISFSGTPSKSGGSVTYTSIMNITYL
ncbi:hypothetical protein ACUUMB_23215 [Enterobacter kobei]